MNEESLTPLTDVMKAKPAFSPSEWIKFTTEVEATLTVLKEALCDDAPPAHRRIALKVYQQLQSRWA